jgi:hypothetical protein
MCTGEIAMSPAAKGTIRRAAGKSWPAKTPVNSTVALPKITDKKRA